MQQFLVGGGLMALVGWRRIGAVSCLLTAVSAQEMSFDVVSIRAVPPNAPPVMRETDFSPILPGGQYVDSRTNLLFMIAFAYNVRNPSNQLVGLPNWAKNQSFSVAAKPAPDFAPRSAAENREQVRLMLRSMLADRFHLRMDAETRPTRVFNLEAGKGGIKVKEVDPPVPPAKEGYVGAAMSDRGGRLIGNKSTMAGIAAALSPLLKQPVVDQTGLKGYYDFNLRWVATEVEGQPGAVEGLGSEGFGLLISALQDQLGLRLTSVNGQAEYWVVDHVEPPTDN